MYCLLRGEKTKRTARNRYFFEGWESNLIWLQTSFSDFCYHSKGTLRNSGRMVPHYRSYENVAVRSHPLPRRGNGNGTTYGPPAIRHESIALEESFLKQWAQVLHQFGAILALNKNQPCVVRYTPTKSHWLRQSGAVRWDLQK